MNDYLHVHGDCMYVPSVPQYRGSEMGNAESDGPRSVALELDDLVRTLHNLLVQFVPLFRVVFCAHRRIYLAQPNAGDVDAGPHSD